MYNVGVGILIETLDKQKLSWLVPCWTMLYIIGYIHSGHDLAVLIEYLSNYMGRVREYVNKHREGLQRKIMIFTI